MFYWEVYKVFNPDLKFTNPEDYIKHFLEIGRYEGRRFDITQFSPYFKTFIYKHNYLDLRELSDSELQVHWITKGFYEARIADRLVEPIEKINSNFTKELDFSEIDRIIYINLETRQDRRVQIENELKWINYPIEKIIRFNAIKNKRGYIGCTLSHINCLEYAIKNNLRNILILEDDFTFKRNSNYFEECINQIKTIKNWDVILFSTNLRSFEKINNNIFKTNETKTAAGYLVNSHYFNKLLENYKAGLKLLLETNDYCNFAIDVYWKNLQIIDKWLLFFPTLGYQSISFSDIEKKIVNYGDIC